jgi:hypothetical protein
MFRYRLHSPDGDDLGEATYAMQIKPGEVIHLSAGQRLRVLDVVSLEEADELGFVGMLKVEAATGSPIRVRPDSGSQPGDHRFRQKQQGGRVSSNLPRADR